MKRKYVIYRQVYECYGGGEPEIFSKTTNGQTERECLVRLIGDVLDCADEADEAIHTSDKAMLDFINGEEIFNGDGRDFILVFDVKQDKKVFG